MCWQWSGLESAVNVTPLSLVISYGCCCCRWVILSSCPGKPVVIPTTSLMQCLRLREWCVLLLIAARTGDDTPVWHSYRWRHTCVTLVQVMSHLCDVTPVRHSYRWCHTCVSEWASVCLSVCTVSELLVEMGRSSAECLVRLGNLWLFGRTSANIRRHLWLCICGVLRSPLPLTKVNILPVSY